jgi:hypothetical protein
VTKSYDYVERRIARFQTVVTAVIANRQVMDGIDVVVQRPSRREAEEDYLRATGQERYEQLGQARERLLELLHDLRHRREDKKRTEIIVELVEQLEREGPFPEAHYAFDNGVLTVELTRLLARKGQGDRINLKVLPSL